MKIDFKDLLLNIEYVAIDKIKPFERNPRTHTKEQIGQIAISMMKFGWVNPILVDENYEIIAGHGRLLAGQEIGYTDVPVAKLEHLSPQEKLALLVADNRITENAGWDDGKLHEVLQELHDEKFDLSVLGFSNKELENFKAEFESEQEVAETIDNAPEISDAVISKPGDIWLLGEHVLLCGDSLIKENLEILMEGEKATMTFTDPPYNVSYDGGAGARKNDTVRTIKNDNLGNQFQEFLIEASARILENTLGSIYICMGGSELHTLYNAFKAMGGRWETYIVWIKNHFSFSRARYQHQHEWVLFGDSAEPPYKEQHEEIFVGRNKGGEIPWYGGRSQSDVWNFDKPSKNDLHPTMKPIALVERAINNSSKVMDIVLDTFGGSGSTLIACEKTQRRCRMIELDEKYVDVIVRRWQEFTGEAATHKQSGKTFTELQTERGQ